VKRFLLSGLLLFFTLSSAYGYFWNDPSYIVAGGGLSDVKVVTSGEDILIFYLVRGKNSSRMELYRTRDLQSFEGPSVVVPRIPIEERFYPHFDVLSEESLLSIAWNTPGGALHLAESTDGGGRWSEVESFESGPFGFDPRLFRIRERLVMFYHTESEGRRVDFYYIFLNPDGSWSDPVQIARGFAGSFFPSVTLLGGKPSVVFQARLLSETEVPVFDIYLSTAEDITQPWSDPVDLTKNDLGEDERPSLISSAPGLPPGGFALVWESNRSGAWGIYYREFDGSGAPLGDETKVNQQPASARDPKVLQYGGETYIFYTDERDGKPKLYYAVQGEEGFRESGPVNGGEESYYEHDPLSLHGDMYTLWRNDRGIGVTGPDRSVKAVSVDEAGKYIGLGGRTLVWKKPEDPSGIRGYAWLFNKNERDDPFILNLPADLTSVRLEPEEEGNYFFHIKVFDGAGNESETLTIPYTVDLTAPPAPRIGAVDTDEEGYYPGNSPVFTWTAQGDDLAGFNFTLSRKKVDLKNSLIRTKRERVRFDDRKGGAWFFNVAAVDRAGNLSPTSRVALRLRPLPEKIKPEPLIAPPWAVLTHDFEINPFLNVSLYIVLFGLFFITFYIALDVFGRYQMRKEGERMAQARKTQSIRRKGLGLRLKFSLLIGVLVLLLTIGISLVLSLVTIENERQALAGQMIDKAKLTVQNMAGVASEGILNRDVLLLTSLIRKTMQNEDVLYSYILDESRKFVAHSDTEQIGSVPEDDFSLLASRSDSEVTSPEFVASEKLPPHYDLSAPVMFAGKRIGTAVIGYSTASVFETIREARRTSIFNTIVITIVTILVGIAGAILMATVTIRPIKNLAEGANIIGGGDLNHKITVRARDEIGMLADEFNRMTSRLLVYQQQIQQKAKLDEQIQIARNIQQDLIPRTGIDADRLSINGFYKAATGVGGDYYDYVEIGGGQYGLIMSDVAGKGVPASLMMIMIRTVFKSLIKTGVDNPARVISLINSTLAADISNDRFATLLFGVVDTNAGEFRYTNAGYGPLMIYRKRERGCSLIDPERGSIPIGVLADVAYNEENPIPVEPGDMLLLFTDGIHEARNEKEEEYGIDRLRDVVPRFADHEAKGVTTGVIGDVMDFVGSTEQYDDMTLLIMKMKEEEGKKEL
jgi:serine phosphatase RsbU (regulator of sigma subunit)